MAKIKSDGYTLTIEKTIHVPVKIIFHLVAVDDRPERYADGSIMPSPCAFGMKGYALKSIKKIV